MLCTKVSPEYVPKDILSVGDRQATVAQNCQSLACSLLWGFPWFLLQLYPWAHQLFEGCSDTHGHPDIPQIKIRGVQVRWMKCPLDVTLSADQTFLKSLSQPVKSGIWCVWGRPVLLEPLVISISPSLTSEWCPEPPQHCFITFLTQRSSSNQCGPIMPWLCREVLYPSKHYFCYWHVLTAETALCQRTKHDPKSLDCLRLCHKTINTFQHALPCKPLRAFALFESGKDKLRSD